MDTSKLDLKNDQNYIVNQVLAYGTLNDLKWLFSTYPKEEIKSVFCNHPGKDYTPSSLNFIKNILLDIPDDVDKSRYVRTLPRYIGQ